MLSSSYLASVSDGLVELYSQLESDIISDMARRLRKIGNVSDATVYQAKIMQEMGGVRDDVNRWLSKYDTKTQTQLKTLFNEALEKSAAKDMAQLNKATGMSEDQKQIAEATVKKVAHQGIVTGSKKVRNDAENGYMKVFSGIQRATMTMADSASNEFVMQANKAYMKVASGAFDYDTAIKQGVMDLARKNVDVVVYTDSGKPIKRSVEAMLRTNIMTGINQTATQITLDNCDDIGCELVEVSAHIGARPEHEAWQGKIYSLTPNNPKYPYFYTACDYGSPTGICGINCRHSFYPYFEGTERLYSKGQLDEYKDKSVQYEDTDGEIHKLTVYEAEQKQRQIERKIRYYKRTAAGLESSGYKDSVECLAARNKLYKWQEVQRDFIRQTGLKRDYSREFVGTKTGTQPRGLKSIEEPKEKKTKKIDSIISSTEKENIIPEYHDCLETFSADRYARTVLGIEKTDYDKMDLGVVNLINKCLTEIKNKFPVDIKKISYSYESTESYAAYSPISKSLIFYNLSDKGAVERLKNDAERNYSNGFWSTKRPTHAIEHEILHNVIHKGMDNDKETLQKIKDIYIEKKKLVLDNSPWSKDNTIAREKAKQLGISYYSLHDLQDFMTESFVEYLEGNPRPIAAEVCKLMLGR